MKGIRGKLPGVFCFVPNVAEDRRGVFMESYNRLRMNEWGVETEFIQDNQSLSVEPGTLRGLHYQLNPKAQSKLVRVISGAVFDVVVDVRRNSPTFGQWEGFELSAANKMQLWVPRGFAHGFCTLQPRTEVLYKVDEYYSPEHDRGIIWNDPAIGIKWPIDHPILSEKDTRQPTLANAELNFFFEG